MAIEIPNVVEMLGNFIGQDPIPPPFNSPIINARGVLPLDPATTAADPSGGFTRLAVGSYLVGMVNSIDFLEGIALATCQPGKPAEVCAIIGAGGDGTVGVITGDGVDFNFQLGVWRISYGEDIGAVPPP